MLRHTDSAGWLGESSPYIISTSSVGRARVCGIYFWVSISRKLLARQLASFAMPFWSQVLSVFAKTHSHLLQICLSPPPDRALRLSFGGIGRGSEGHESHVTTPSAPLHGVVFLSCVRIIGGMCPGAVVSGAQAKRARHAGMSIGNHVIVCYLSVHELEK